MSSLAHRRILLGVSGGIAAYKTPDLVRRLREAGAQVDVQLTDAGARFVSPLALEVVSGHPVGRSLWDTSGDSEIVHTDAGAEADLIILAPATANLVGRLRHGLADDLLTCTVMACSTPVLICPAMNTRMWDNPLVQENLSGLLAHQRFQMLSPDVGELACGVVGPGRLPEAHRIVDEAARVLSGGLGESESAPSRDLEGLRFTVTAGPTREAIDPVRYLTNHSTGTMGVELIRGLVARGAQACLVAGPGVVDTPWLEHRIDVETAADMATVVEDMWDLTDVLVMAAAVADYRPATSSENKLRKSDGPMALELERTRDILADASRRPDRDRRVLVGFCAETQELLERARGKMERKDLDFIVANPVGGSGVGFGTGDNEGWLLGRGGARLELKRTDKRAFAHQILEHLVPELRTRFGLDDKRDV